MGLTLDSAVCNACPRRCGVPRGRGFCGSQPRVASVCVHRGEEPPLNPIVNIFFTGCNLQCIYCQNWQISRSRDASGRYGLTDSSAMSVDAIVDDVCRQHAVLGGGDTFLLGFVTAAHCPAVVPAVVEALRRRGLQPTVVYNSSGYESVDTLRSLEGLVDIYLPDLKYKDPALADAYSHAPDYPEVAEAAIMEMQRQVGASLKVDDDGMAYRGMLVRHLVLPGALDNTRRCLQWLADTMPPSVALSVMAQYFPPRPGLPAPLDRTLLADEYDEALRIVDTLGFFNVYTQQLDARDNYRPDFSRQGHPFEK